MSDVLERFADIAYAALREVGHEDLIMPSFLHDGVPYMEFDTDDHPDGSPEFAALIKAEQIALMSLGFPVPTE